MAGVICFTGAIVTGVGGLVLFVFVVSVSELARMVATSLGLTLVGLYFVAKAESRR